MQPIGYFCNAHAGGLQQDSCLGCQGLGNEMLYCMTTHLLDDTRKISCRHIEMSGIKGKVMMVNEMS